MSSTSTHLSIHSLVEDSRVNRRKKVFKIQEGFFLRMKMFLFIRKFLFPETRTPPETLPYSLAFTSSLTLAHTNTTISFIKFFRSFFCLLLFCYSFIRVERKKKFFFIYFLHWQLVQKERLYDNHHVRYMC